MYSKSADYYDKLYAKKDYEGEAARLAALIRERHPAAVSLLDVACGTGKHLSCLKREFRVEGVDSSRRGIAAARASNPEIDFHVGDMRRFRLGSRFDVVTCLFSSIGYMTRPSRLDEAVRNMARHLAPLGILIVEPWFGPEDWHPPKAHAAFVDESELKIARISTSGARGSISIMDIHYLVATPERVEHFSEKYKMGLFTRERMLRAFESAGLSVEYDDKGLTGRGLYIARAPA
jgi:SAM-dependent methyltransferase